MDPTEYSHFGGDLVTFNNKLTAIAGFSFDMRRKVEVLNNGSGQWNSSIIRPIPIRDHIHGPYATRSVGNSYLGPALVITEFGRDTLFSFGKSSVITV